MKRNKQVRTFEGLPVVDADNDIVINVTKKDVLNSTKKDPNNCAAARAGKRELHKEVKVYLSRVYVKDRKHWVRYLTPGNMAREIVSFDRGTSFIPGEYIFKAATPGQKLGSHRGINHKNTGTGKKRQLHHITHGVRVSAREGYEKK